MEARVKTQLPEPPGWTYEPKWDGFRVLAWSAPVRSDSRNGKLLLRYFPELVPALEALPDGTVVDGEVLIVRDGVSSFDALQMRIHPAQSRITLLSRETPARLVAFDLLALDGADLRTEPFAQRRAWFRDFEAAGCDGIVAKRLGQAYVGGKIGSLLLGLYDGHGELEFVGHCSGFSDHNRVELLDRFSQLRADDSFTNEGRRPGTESRWSAGKDSSWTPVQPGVVVQVSYNQVTEGRFRHATRFERWRPDKQPDQCTTDQLERPQGPGFEAVVAAPG